MTLFSPLTMVLPTQFEENDNPSHYHRVKDAYSNIYIYIHASFGCLALLEHSRELYTHLDFEKPVIVFTGLVGRCHSIKDLLIANKRMT